jgi:hypothetical protein
MAKRKKDKKDKQRSTKHTHKTKDRVIKYAIISIYFNCIAVQIYIWDCVFKKIYT